jgi:multiple sugar transport system ATP-binding protein
VEILNLHKRLEATFVYVTHDQTEAMTMGNRIVVMNASKVQQVDNPQTIYSHPANMFVAGFIGSPPMNFMEVSVGGEGPVSVQGQGFTLAVPERMLSSVGAVRGQDVVLGVRPEDLKDSRFAEAGLPRVHATVELVEMMGNEIFVHARVGEKSLTCRMDNRSDDLQAGQELELSTDIDRIHLFDATTELALENRA